MSYSHQKSIKGKILFLAEELLSLRVQRASLLADLNGMTASVKCMRKGVGKSLSNVFTEVQ